MSVPSLVVTHGNDRGKVYPLARNAYVLGRGHEVDIPVLDPKCSRQHCRVERRPDGFYVTDLSSNGTRVNGQLMRTRGTQRLSANDQLQFGQVVIEFRDAAAAPQAQGQARPQGADALRAFSFDAPPPAPAFPAGRNQVTQPPAPHPAQGTFGVPAQAAPPAFGAPPAPFGAPPAPAPF
ncbi:MAG: FHA domain-containing protein, partial [Planctomycetes bacterium]|nr:FHA domain-containing protein [Planctomycetota bacterium]